MVLDFDLNNHPSVENEFQMGNPIDVNTTLELRVSQIQETIDHEQARERSRRNGRATELPNEELESQRSYTAGSSRIGSHLLSVHLDVQRTALSESAATPQIPPVSQPKEPTFICAICIDEIVEATSTKCGHIFCKTCIDAALDTQKKCPTCRRKLKVKDTFRVYLPAANE